MRALRTVGEACVFLVGLFYLFSIAAVVLLVLLLLVVGGFSTAARMPRWRHRRRDRAEGQLVASAVGVAIGAVAVAAEPSNPAAAKAGVEGVPDKSLVQTVFDFVFGPRPPTDLDIEYAQARGEPVPAKDSSLTGNSLSANLMIVAFYVLSAAGTVWVTAPLLCSPYDGAIWLVLTRLPLYFTAAFLATPLLRFVIIKLRATR